MLTQVINWKTYCVISIKYNLVKRSHDKEEPTVLKYQATVSMDPHLLYLCTQNEESVCISVWQVMAEVKQNLRLELAALFQKQSKWILSVGECSVSQLKPPFQGGYKTHEAHKPV